MKKRYWCAGIIMTCCVTAAGCGRGMDSGLVSEGTQGKQKEMYKMEALAPKATGMTAGKADVQNVPDQQAEVQTGVQETSQAGMQAETQTEVQEMSQAGMQTETQTGVQEASQAGMQTEIQTGVQNVSQAGMQTEIQTRDASQAGMQTEIQTGDASQAGMQNVQQAGIQAETSTEISLQQAMEIVLARVPGAEEKHLVIERDIEDGHLVYEGEIKYNGKEYEFEMCTAHGHILEWSEEYD